MPPRQTVSELLTKPNFNSLLSNLYLISVSVDPCNNKKTVEKVTTMSNDFGMAESIVKGHDNINAFGMAQFLSKGHDNVNAFGMAQFLSKGYDNVKCLWDGKIHRQRS